MSYCPQMQIIRRYAAQRPLPDGSIVRTSRELLQTRIESTSRDQSEDMLTMPAADRCIKALACQADRERDCKIEGEMK